VLVKTRAKTLVSFLIRWKKGKSFENGKSPALCEQGTGDKALMAAKTGAAAPVSND